MSKSCRKYREGSQGKVPNLPSPPTEQQIKERDRFLQEANPFRQLAENLSEDLPKDQQDKEYKNKIKKIKRKK